MILIICGGRSYHLLLRDFARLDALHADPDTHVSEVVTGHQTGADRDGEAWALSHGIYVDPAYPFEVKPEEWRPPHLGGKIDYSAGPRRNGRMAAYAGPDGGCVAFPGGKGTADMVRKATAAGLRVWDWRGEA